MLHSKRVALLVVLQAAIGLFATSAALAGKPAPPPPPPAPAGTLFYWVANPGVELRLFGMQGNGTGKTDTGFTSDFVPSNLIYPQGVTPHPVHDRWFLLRVDTGRDEATDHPRMELFAVRTKPNGDIQKVQLTKFYGNPNTVNPVSMTWSNDGDDSFIAIQANEGHFEGTRGILDAKSVYKLHVSGVAIDAAAEIGMHLNIEPDDPEVEVLLRTPAGVGNPNSILTGDHHFAPDGRRFAYIRNGSATPQISVYDPDLPSTTDLWPLTGLWTSSPRWSPSGSRITFHSGADLWTIAPNGTQATRVLAATSNQSYRSPVWSPDSTNLAHTVRRVQGAKVSYFVARTPSTGGTPIILTNELNPAVDKGAHWWVSNDVAP